MVGLKFKRFRILVIPQSRARQPLYGRLLSSLRHRQVPRCRADVVGMPLIAHVTPKGIRRIS